MHRRIEAFLEMMSAERGAARNTIAAYAADLDDFAAFCAAAGTEPDAADEATLRRYLAGLHAAGLSARTAARRLSALRQFHLFLLREGVRADDPTATLEASRPGRRLPRVLGEQEVLALIADGLSNAAIAAKLALSDHTVKRHVANILLKPLIALAPEFDARLVSGGRLGLSGLLADQIELAIRYVASEPAVTTLQVGIATVDQFEGAARAAAKGSLDADSLGAIARIQAGLGA